MSANPHPRSAARTAQTAEIQVHQGEMRLPDPFALEAGGDLRQACLAWCCVGPAGAPLILVLGGISAHRHCSGEAARGWWQAQCGAGLALDSNRHRLLSVDWLGGCDASTAAQGSGGIPAISTSDQARALLILLNRLGVRRVHLIVGASYGGSVAQQLAALLGERVRHLVILSAAHRSAQFALALRHVQRAILDLAGDGARQTEALALARSLALLGYRTPQALEQRFGARDPEAGVCAWLDHHGRRFVERFDSATYRCLSRSLDSHRIDPGAIRAPTTLVAVREDLIVPIALLREFAARIGAHCRLVEIESIYGHDAFLKEDAQIAQILRNALEDAP